MGYRVPGWTKSTGTVVDGDASQPAEVTSGDTQGRVLGLTLFFIYINDIAENMNSNI